MKTPAELIENINRHTNDISLLSERLVALNKLYAEFWNDNRQEYTSDKQADKAWDLTKEGVEMMEIKTKIKVKTAKISADKMTYRHMENEAKNQF